MLKLRPWVPRLNDVCLKLKQKRLGSGRSFTGRAVIFVFGGVEIKDLASLPGARVDGTQVLAALHLPDGRDLAVLLHGLIGYLFSLSRGRRVLRIR